MSAYRLAPECDADVDAIWLYIARGSGNIDTSTRVVENFSDHFRMLAQHPYSERVRGELRLGVRSFAAGDYLIICRIERVEDDDFVLILAWCTAAETSMRCSAHKRRTAGIAITRCFCIDE